MSRLVSGALRRFALWSVALTLAALVLLYGASREPLWLDETYTLSMVRRGLGEILIWTARDVHPPLYYLTLRCWTQLLGSSPLALRSLSVAFTLGMMGLGAGPIRRLWGRRAGIVFASLVFLSPGSVAFAGEGRMYTMAAYCVLGAFLYGQRALASHRRIDWWLFGVHAVAAAYTHYFALLAVAVNLVLLLVQVLRGHKAELRTFSLVVLTAALAYCPWVPSVFAQVERVAAGFWIPPTPFWMATLSLTSPFTYKFEDLLPPWNAILASSLCGLLFACGLWIAARRGRGEPGRGLRLSLTLFLGTLAAGILVSLVVAPVLMPRYIICNLGVFLLAVVLAVELLPWRWLRAAVVAAIVGVTLPTTVQLYTKTFNGPFLELEAFIRPRSHGDDVFLHGDVQTFFSLWHRFPKHRHVLVVSKPSDVVPGDIALAAVPELEITADLPGVLAKSRRFWVVNMEPCAYTPFQVGPAVRRRAGRLLEQKAESRRFALPMSWVKVRLSCFAQR